MKKTIFNHKTMAGLVIAAASFAAVLAGFNFVLAAWVEPTADPPGGNIAAPLNVDTNFTGDVTGKYNALKFNFSCALNQTLKWDGVKWICADGGQNYWALIGNNIYNTNTGNVGVGGAAAPVDWAKLLINMGSANTAEGLHIKRGVSATYGYSYLNIEDQSGNPVFKVHQSGNVGIGTTNPDYLAKLEVAGQIKITGGSPGIGKVLSAVDNSGLAAWQTRIGGGGTTNYIPKFTDSHSIVNSIIYDTGTNIGIGTISPTQKLDINGRIRIRGDASDVPVAGEVLTAVDNTGLAVWQAPSGGGGLPSGTDGQTLRNSGYGINTNWVANSVLYNNGTNVGIGTENPGGKLNVYSTSPTAGTVNYGVRAQALGTNNQTNIAVRGTADDGSAPNTSFGGYFEGGLYADEICLDSLTNCRKSWPVDSQWLFGSNASIYYLAGNVGIGTNNPAEKVEVRDDTAATARIRITDLAQNPELQLQYGSNSDEHWAIYNNQSNDSLNIWNSGYGRLTILQNGNVGIGTTNPDSELSIAGDTPTGITLMGPGNYTGRLLVSGSVVYVGSVHSSVDLALQAGGTNRVYINSSGNVGIGTTNPTAKLEVNGGVKLNTTSVRPACDSTTRGTLWFIQGAAGTKDSLSVCAKAADNTYGWRTIY